MTGRNWLVTALVASVTLNVFLGSMIAGRVVYERLEANDQETSRSHHHARSSLRLELRALGSALPEEARKTLRDTLRKKRKEMQPAFNEITERRREIRALLTADTFDPKALQEAVNRLNTALGAIQAPLQAVILESATHMTPEQRKDMAKALAEAERHYHRAPDKSDKHKK